MSKVGQSPWATPTVFNGVFNGIFKFLFILGYSTSLGRTHIWISLVAHYWISLVALFLDLWTILRKLDFSVREIY